jgi:hypothetical protein
VRRLTLACLAALLTLSASAARAAVELEARVSRTQLSVGESVVLDVVVRGAGGGVQQPEFDVPPGLEILGSSRQQSFSWINGRSTSEILYRYELSPSITGSFRVGPIRVRVGNQVHEAHGTTLSVGAEPTRIGAAGDGPAELRVDVEPSAPVVGQPVILRVRLIQRTPLAEDPQYLPPPTPGFWSEEATRPESFYADEGGRRVLVTETRTRMYPISVGTTTIGEAVASLVVASSSGVDPLQWLRGQASRRAVTVRSKPLEIRVRGLPGGAPAAFSGAVGDLSAAWSADRRQTRLNVPITVRLDLRGIGNLPLVHAPPLDSDAFEIFSSTVEDSMPAAGRLAVGRRRFAWTALPRREGRLEIAAPAFAWYDPARGRYVTADPSPIAVEVGPALDAGEGPAATLPRELGSRPLDPFGRPALPWAWAIAGLALGTAVTLWRVSARAPADAADRARQREWLRVVGLAGGADFWRATEEASAWAQARGADVQHLRKEIASARYGGSAQNTESVRRRVIELLGAALPPTRPRWPLQLTAALLVGSAIVLALLTGPRPGPGAGVIRARAADQAAAAGRAEEARREWLSLWREGGRAPGLAARLAWSHVRDGEIGPAAVWVLRGEAQGGRDGALGWVREQVREGGGLAGEDPAHLPVRPLEWAVLALLAGIAAGLAVFQRARAAALLAATLAFALVRPVESFVQARTTRAVLMTAATLEGPGLDLEAGHVVRVLGEDPERLRVSAGRGVEGWVARAAVDSLRESP